MSDSASKSGDHPSVRQDIDDHAPSPQPFLRMRPRHFFSNKFDMDIVEDYSESDANEHSVQRPKWLSRLIQMNLLLMILLIGVPVLLYCIMVSAK
ncbi:MULTISPECIES: hypothetical protein [Sphingomonas]|uniref:hypothetical protein n=1 Tax=Sphingomonas TaxID=13687 RepID=UPI0020BE9B2A|nr:hypothetical protein [Sphingomonas faeni]MCK8457579.1 hypothetical protein [Sphingomonas faeni]